MSVLLQKIHTDVSNEMFGMPVANCGWITIHGNLCRVSTIRILAILMVSYMSEHLVKFDENYLVNAFTHISCICIYIYILC